jgi:uncharacterized membrane protein (DUF106 family)
MFAIGLQFVLFAILGWCVFAPPANNKLVLMVVFVVLMVLWAVGTVGTSAGWFGR